jgi:hypothetical protein
MLPWPSDTLRAVSERYKSLNERLVISANMAGELKLRVEADEVKVETRWKGLINPALGTPPPPTSHFCRRTGGGVCGCVGVDG